MVCATIKPTRVRIGIGILLFIVTTINFADRASISVVASALKTDLGITSVTLGYVFSAFSWAYVLAQLPGGALLDRYGSKRVYTWSMLCWSLCTLTQGFLGLLPASVAVMALLGLRFLLGVAESPAFPANARIVASWFPKGERGTASTAFQSSQYAALVIFAPLMAWIAGRFNWHDVFLVMGTLGLLSTLMFHLLLKGPTRHPRVNKAELAYLVEGGALVDLDAPASPAARPPFSWAIVGELLSSRMLLGIYVGQYCINALTYFFSTWFPIYLVQGRGMSIIQAGFSAAIPAICGFLGNIVGGIVSDGMIRRGHSVTFARKAPFIAGMSFALAIVACDFTSSPALVIGLMAFAFFGKGMAALGWAIMADVAPRQVTGTAGSIFNGVGNIAGIVTPIAIGYLVHRTGSFNLALAFVAAHAVLGIAVYVFVVGPIRRVQLRSIA